MPDAALFAYAYLLGTAFSALVGAAAELRAGAEAGMRPPFLSQSHIFRSLGLTLAAGSYLLVSELRTARGKGFVTVPFALAGIAFASIWALATGILLVELMAQIRSAL
jgi:hypothetical protein